MKLCILISSLFVASSFLLAPPKKDSNKTVSSRSKQEKKDKDNELLDGILNSTQHQEAVKKVEQEASYRRMNSDQDVKKFLKTVIIGNIPLCQSFLDKGLDINATDGEKNTALHYAVVTKSVTSKKNDNKKHIEMIDFLLAHGADPNLPNNRKNTPLMITAEQGQEDVLQKLIASGAHVDIQNLKGITALAYSVFHNNLGCMESLLKAGAKDLQNALGTTALMAAIQKRHIEAAQKLIAQTDFDVSKKDLNGNTALHFATMTTLPTIVESLLACNADCNALNQAKCTALMYVFDDKENKPIDPDAKNIARMLLLHGADPTLTHNGIFLALAYAKKHKQDELAPLIREYTCKKLEEKNNTVLLQKSFQILVDHRNYKRTERLEKKRIEDASACQALEQKNKIVTLRECYRKLFDYRRNLPPDSIPNKIWADLRDDDDEQRFLNRDE